MKTDARVRYTKMVLKDALIQCMREKALKDITVTEVCEIAEVNRATFYNHYKDCTDIIREMEQEQLDDFRKLMESKDVFGTELIRDVLDQIEKGRAINRTAKLGYFSEHYIDELAKIAKEYAFDAWQKRMPKATDREVDLALSIMISATLQIVIREIDSCDRETVVRHIENMLGSVIKMYDDQPQSAGSRQLQSIANQYAKKYDAVMIANLNTPRASA